MPTGKRKLLFQLLSILCSVPLSTAINWLIHTPNYSWGAFADAFCMVPLTFCIVFCVRVLFANPLVDRFVKVCISPHMKAGMRKSLCITFVNVLFMGTNVGLLKLLVFGGGLGEGALQSYFLTLPMTYCVSFLLGFFIISPMMKKAFKRTIEPIMEALPDPAEALQKPRELVHAAEARLLCPAPWTDGRELSLRKQIDAVISHRKASASLMKAA